MIFVDRSRASEPPILLSDRAKAAQAKAHKYFSVPRAKRLQSRFDFDASIWKECLDALAILFHQKCAYCESPYLHATGSALDHFRPKSLAVGLSGDLAKTYSTRGEDLPDGYWWLAYEWDNLYHVCQTCNLNKRNMFPVSGPRAKQGTIGDGLSAEFAVLLDPCRDMPENFFVFDEAGYITPNPSVTKDQQDRAALTIQILGLNRATLVHERHLAAMDVASVLKSFRFSGSRSSFRELVQLLQPSQSYLAVRRPRVRQWIKEFYQRQTVTLKARFLENVNSSLAEFNSLLSPRELATANLSFDSTQMTTATPPQPGPAPQAKGPGGRGDQIRPLLPAGITPSPYISRHGGYVQSIEISNFKAIEYLKIDIPSGSPDRIGWKVLLGENGAGKSSVLQAVALALLGDTASEYAYTPRRMLRKLPKKEGLAGSGFVRIQLSSAPDPIEMRFTPKGIAYAEGSALPVDLILRGYGPTRLMPRPGRRRAPRPKALSTKPGPRSDAANLFDPFQPVCNPSVWLNRLESKEAFASAALSLKDLLRIPQKTWLHREKGSVIVPLDGLPITLDELSAGYESILVLAVDIMSAIHGTVHDMRQAAGIVLLDEIDAHLHPRWKMEIVNALRRCFPLIQFIATTHEPLCLRGLDDGEVAVMRRVGSHIVLEGNLPSPAGQRVDQLLTSPYFGLQSTLNPELDQKFMSYYALLAKREQDLTPEQRASRDALKLDLAGVGVLGHTRRDQLVYEAIDEYLAKESSQSIPTRSELRAETKQRIAAILADLSNAGESSS